MSNDPGILYVIATPIGNLDDISHRALTMLAAVDYIAAEDTRHTRRLLQQFAIETPMLSLHQHNEGQMADKLVDRLHGGQSIALVSDAGTPLISDPGFPLVRRCREAGIQVSPVPGASALIAALSVSGLPTDHFLFEGFVPRTQSARITYLQGLSKQAHTMVFYESSHRIAACIGDMAVVFGGQRPVFLAREITKLYEDLRLTTLAQLSKQMVEDSNLVRGEFVVVIAGLIPDVDDEIPEDVLRLLEILCAELPVKQAAALAAKHSGIKKNRLYQAALSLKEAP